MVIDEINANKGNNGGQGRSKETTKRHKVDGDDVNSTNSRSVDSLGKYNQEQ